MHCRPIPLRPFDQTHTLRLLFTTCTHDGCDRWHDFRVGGTVIVKT